MRPFTYGAAGWAVQAYIALGLPERAKSMLSWHFQPEALKKNAAFFAERLGVKTKNVEAMSFGHEVMLDGSNNPSGQYELQRQLDGFAAAAFHRFAQFYPDERFAETTVYPVLRGSAEFWCNIAQLDDKTGCFIMPKMTSLTEDLIATDLIDAALAAKWCLIMAHRYAVTMNKDAELRTRWKTIADKLLIPQANQRYLEFLGDDDNRAGGGYQGVRGFVYLGYPTMELIPTLDREKAQRTLDYTWTRNLTTASA
jgi:hypothetical protein